VGLLRGEDEVTDAEVLAVVELVDESAVGRRTASIYTSDFSPAALDALVQETVAMARLTGEDSAAGLPDEPPADRGLQTPGRRRQFEPGLLQDQLPAIHRQVGIDSQPP
jgi:predicted Zn-dependent protease